MKKIIRLLIVVGAIFSLSSCGNYMILDTTYEFNKVHVHNENKCYDVYAWTDYEGEQLQVQLEDGTVLLISSINATLVKGECPFCKE